MALANTRTISLPRACVAWLLVAAATTASAAATPPGVAVASAHPQATAAGLEILESGGNAFDAAVAVSAALAVVEPQSSGLGGGGFWLLRLAADGRAIMVDGREQAPAAATEDMYLDADQNYVEARSKDGPLAAGIPGEPAALAHIAARYGHLDLATSLAPAIKLARGGFQVDEHMRKLLTWRREALQSMGGAAADVFLVGGELPPAGKRLRQPVLAGTLERLAQHGRAGFYRGATAQALVNGVRAAGGIWTLQDLADYAVVERDPIRFRYRGYEVISASPPSSGGVVLAEALHVLEPMPWPKLDAVRRKHATVEAMRRAYRDRAAYLGDPDLVDMPIARLTSRAYADGLRAGLNLERATPSELLAAPDAGPRAGGGGDTTHFSIIDADGNQVAATLSVNYPFGSGFMPADTGVVLNNEMDDFSAKPLTPNGYGLLGAGANAIAPGKRPLSSMSPTFVRGPERSAVLGTPGGSRIISMVLLGILEFTEGGSAADIAGLPRFHHQYQPDHIYYEPAALSESEQQRLEAMGHTLELSSREYGDMQVVVWDRTDNRLTAASDPRGIGSAVVREAVTPAGRPQPASESERPLAKR